MHPFFLFSNEEQQAFNPFTFFFALELHGWCITFIVLKGFTSISYADEVFLHYHSISRAYATKCIKAFFSLLSAKAQGRTEWILYYSLFFPNHDLPSH